MARALRKCWCAPSIWVALLSYGYITTAQSGNECDPPTWIEPSPGTTVAEARPKLIWKSHPGIKRHQLRVTSRVPEGEIKVALDTMVESENFLPPAPLADHQAKVTVSIKPACDSEQFAKEQVVQFYIDTSVTCEAAPPRRADAATIVWAPAANALGYEVYVYRMPEGGLAQKFQSRSTHYALPENLRSNAVLALRAHCPSGYGDLKYLLLR